MSRHDRTRRCIALLNVATFFYLQTGPTWSEELFALESPAPVEQISLEDIRALDIWEHPTLNSESDQITFTEEKRGAFTRIVGRCLRGSRVVIAGNRLRQSTITPCVNGKFETDLGNDLFVGGDELNVTQLTLNGSILVNRISTPDTKSMNSALIAADFLELPRLVEASVGGTIILAPGRYSNVQMNFAATTQWGARVIVDGEGKVAFDGRTQISIARSNLTLRGIQFLGDDETFIEITGEGDRISNSEFLNCGQTGKPKGQCILISPGAKSTEIDFNRFSQSQSMTLKLRAGPSGTSPQPTHAYIHHNVFKDVERNSSNGQEAIQVAGPNGGGSDAVLQARIEHNLFDAANGDVEAISLKTPGVRVRWNSFYKMDAAPNFRGANNNEISGNVLQMTRGIRVAGNNHLLFGNIIVCPNGPGIALSHGTEGYARAERNTVEQNLVISPKSGVVFFAQQQGPLKLAHDNIVSRNIIFSPKRYPPISDQKNERDPAQDNSIKDNITGEIDQAWCRQ